MIYAQLQMRAKLEMGQPLRLGAVARLIGPDGAEAIHLPCPDEQGIWKLQALHVARALQEKYPGQEITLLGADVCYVHRVKALRPDPTRPLRTAAALLILCLGGALGLCWFHADVNMPQAQFALYEALTGEAPREPRLITIPYAAGVVLGVAVFYALPSRKATTPLEVKLTEYQSDMEQTEARDID